MIRRMKRSDIEKCADLIRESFLTVAQEFGLTKENAPRYAAFFISPERLEWQSMEQRAMYVYENEEGELVGYFSIHVAGFEECELLNLCVKPKYRHQKIGQELLSFAINEAKRWEFETLSLGIMEENIRLREWLEDLGARHIGSRKFDFFPFTCGYMKVNLK